MAIYAKKSYFPNEELLKRQQDKSGKSEWTFDRKGTRRDYESAKR